MTGTKVGLCPRECSFGSLMPSRVPTLKISLRDFTGGGDHLAKIRTAVIHESEVTNELKCKRFVLECDFHIPSFLAACPKAPAMVSSVKVAINASSGDLSLADAERAHCGSVEWLPSDWN
jgi:hypothetical protein